MALESYNAAVSRYLWEHVTAIPDWREEIKRFNSVMGFYLTEHGVPSPATGQKAEAPPEPETWRDRPPML